MSEATSHIFISFSSKDEAVARAVVQFLEAQGLKCWISLRDIRPGQNYQESIVLALEQAKSIVFLFSKSSSSSPEIKKELSLAERLEKPVFPLRLSPITPSGALRYELATRQWIDIFPDREQAFRKLVETIRSVPQDPAEGDAARASTVDSASARKELAAAKTIAQAERRPVMPERCSLDNSGQGECRARISSTSGPAPPETERPHARPRRPSTKRK